MRCSTVPPRVTDHQAVSSNTTKPTVRPRDFVSGSSCLTRSWQSRTTSVSNVTKVIAKMRKPNMVLMGRLRHSWHRRWDEEIRRKPDIFCAVERGAHENSRASYSFSSGKTLTSTRRFFLLWSALLASVIPGTGLSQPLPMTLNLFGSNLYLARMLLRTESARS